MVLSGAAEIGRLDYLKRTGLELNGNDEEIKTDYAAQGQAILMLQYRQFIRSEYSVRQILVEHNHFNNIEKRKHICSVLNRCAIQNAIPIINYNDSVSVEELRKFEISTLRNKEETVVECVDNDETAAVIAELVGAKTLLILTSTEGIYHNPNDPSSLVREVRGKSPEQIENLIRKLQESCVGTSRKNSGVAKSKLEFVINPIKNGPNVIIGHSRHKIEDLLNGVVPCTRFIIE